MRKISEIATDIQRSWPKPYFAALPYLGAMLSLESIEENYGADSARTIISYFLANASTFRGEAARELKSELKAML